LDVNLLIELLEDIGVKTNRSPAIPAQFQADDIDIDFLASEAFKKKVEN
jgi:UDP-N-acetylglucosamine 1-carboxyvinyltransferase